MERCILFSRTPNASCRWKINENSRTTYCHPFDNFVDADVDHRHAIVATRRRRRRRKRRRCRRLGLFDQPADLLQGVHLGVEERRLEHPADGAQPQAIAVFDLLGAELQRRVQLQLNLTNLVALTFLWVKHRWPQAQMVAYLPCPQWPQVPN